MFEFWPFSLPPRVKFDAKKYKSDYLKNFWFSGPVEETQHYRASDDFDTRAERIVKMADHFRENGEDAATGASIVLQLYDSIDKKSPDTRKLMETLLEPYSFVRTP